MAANTDPERDASGPTQSSTESGDGSVAAPVAGTKGAAGAVSDGAGAPPSSVLKHGRLLLLAVVAVAVVALFMPRGASKKAPGGFLVDDGGRPAPLAERMAPVTLIHFYASWCPPCLEEAPSMTRLAKDFAGQPGFRVVMIAVADDVARAKAVAGTDDILFDPQWETAHRYGTRQLPDSYLIVDGKVQRKFEGPVDWDDAQVREALKMAVAQRASRS